MQLEGKLGDVNLVELLHKTAALQKTGILTIQSQDDIIAVTFLVGKIVAADALNEPMDEGLGQVLINQGLIGASDFNEVHGRAKSSGERVSGYLVGEGKVGRDQVLAAVRLQTYRLLLRLIQWTEGDFNLFVGDEISYEEGIEPISIPELLIRSIGDLGELGPLTGEDPDMEMQYQRAPDTRPIRVYGRDGDVALGIGEVWLSEPEERVLRQLEIGARGSTLVQSTALDEYHVRHALHRMMDLGLVYQGRSAQVGDSVATAELRSADEIMRNTGSFLRDTSLQSLLKDTNLDADQTFLRDTGAFGGISVPPAPPPVDTTGAARPATSPVDLKPPARSPELITAFVDLWMGRALAVALALGLILSFVLTPRRNGLFFPYPWQQKQRESFEASQSASLNTKIDGAVRTYYLLYGRFPEQLGLLEDLELLNDNDDRDGRGRYLEYTSTANSYTLQPLENDTPVPGLEHTSDVSLDFLLNPGFAEVESTNRRPLVLLD